jgi:hypothetical protein
MRTFGGPSERACTPARCEQPASVRHQARSPVCYRKRTSHDAQRREVAPVADSQGGDPAGASEQEVEVAATLTEGEVNRLTRRPRKAALPSIKRRLPVGVNR